MNPDNILYKEFDHVALIKVNRPDHLNALNKKTLRQLSQTLSQIESNKNIRAVIITGAGNKSFVAGADIKEFSAYDSRQAEILSREGQREVFDKLEHLKKPVIASINGYALGGGLELALSCHIRYASAHAKLGFPELGLGLIPGYGGTQRLPKIVGKGHAMEMILSADCISAKKAKEIGLVNEIYSAEELLPKTLELANKIASNSPLGAEKVIESINKSDLSTGFETEIKNFAWLFDQEDKKKGVKAFLEKRKAKF
ncbi:MAG: enoyl-CoA hydratase [Bergeyella sp.]|nr:enoyl-CoA hydratase [Bergeyella sp.]